MGLRERLGESSGHARNIDLGAGIDGCETLGGQEAMKSPYRDRRPGHRRRCPTSRSELVDVGVNVAIGDGLQGPIGPQPQQVGRQIATVGLEGGNRPTLLHGEPTEVLLHLEGQIQRLAHRFSRGA